jgi:hypothetical protein
MGAARHSRLGLETLPGMPIRPSLGILALDGGKRFSFTTYFVPRLFHTCRLVIICRTCDDRILLAYYS